MIIADDEYIARDGLRSIIPWAEYGIEIIADAGDGQEALDLCLELKPDILFTDIRMPRMDGLEVAMELKSLGSPIKIIAVSGIQDFNYARTALDVNAEGYILKPVEIQELKDIIYKVTKSIELDNEKKYELTSLKQQLHENLPIIREKFIRNWILGAYKNDRDIREKLKYLKIPLKPDEEMTVALLQIDDYYKIDKNMNEDEKQLLFFSISNVMEEIINNNNAGVCSYINDNEFVALFNKNAQDDSSRMKICDEISRCVGKCLKVPVSIGIGRTVGNVLHVNASYKDALIALQYSFYTGRNSILNISDINILNEENTNRKDVLYSTLYDIENQAISAMKLGDIQKVESHIGNLFTHMNSFKNLPVDYVQSICIEMIYIASRAIFELNENIDNILTNRKEIQNVIYNTARIYDLEMHITNIFVKIAAYFSKKYTQKNSKVISKIKDIVKQKYKENIGVSAISEEIYLSPNYISLIFKQETGETITEYITKVRMEKAKELLKESDCKILEVAEFVGFENPHYFSTVFKKYTGIHPQKYRANTGE